ncbi:MAG: sulfite exporter TauE/SafE family protein [Pseudomonadota bacterium]
MPLFTWPEWGLVITTLVVSTLNATIGVTGGVNFAVMATVLPPAAVVPIHGLIESVASCFRWFILRRFVRYPYVIAFAIGCAVGFACGWPLVGLFSDDTLRIVLGVAILTLAWLPLDILRISGAIGGALSSALTLLIGATGPLVATLIQREMKSHREVIGTHGACTALQHGAKAVLFAAWGFSFGPFLALILAMLIAITIGTWVGRHLLLKVPERPLRIALKCVVTGLGLRLVYQGITGHWSH